MCWGNTIKKIRIEKEVGGIFCMCKLVRTLRCTYILVVGDGTWNPEVLSLNDCWSRTEILQHLSMRVQCTCIIKT